MRIVVTEGARDRPSTCQLCGRVADLTLRPDPAAAADAPPPLDLCHECARTFVRALDARTGDAPQQPAAPVGGGRIWRRRRRGRDGAPPRPAAPVSTDGLRHADEGMRLMKDGRYTEDAFEQALLADELREQWLLLEQLRELGSASGDTSETLRLLREAQAICRKLGDWPGYAQTQAWIEQILSPKRTAPAPAAATAAWEAEIHDYQPSSALAPGVAPWIEFSGLLAGQLPIPPPQVCLWLREATMAESVGAVREYQHLLVAAPRVIRFADGTGAIQLFLKDGSQIPEAVRLLLGGHYDGYVLIIGGFVSHLRDEDAPYVHQRLRIKHALAAQGIVLWT
jgi:hypothetical protein